jgi:hypothetical protein
MNAPGLARFNARKATLIQNLFPATVTFQATGGTAYACSFGETENNGQLHETGQAVDNHRIGVLTLATALYAPGLLQTFTVTVSPQQPHLVGKRFQTSRIVSNPGEPVVKYYCRRMEE